MLKPSFKLITVLLLSTTILTACAQQEPNNGSTSQSTTNNQTAATSTSTSSTKSATETQKKAEEVQKFNIIGSWEATNQLSLNFNEDGSYTILRDGQAKAGTFRVAAEYDNTFLLKLTNYNPQTPGLDTYLYLTTNLDHTINVSNLGIFKSIGTSSKLPTALYLSNYLQEEPENAGDKLVGTWTNKNRENHVITTTNYNPDGSFERFSDASGIVTRGNFAVTSNETEVIITTTVPDHEPNQEKYTRNDAFTELTSTTPGFQTTYSKNILPTTR